MQSTDMQTSHTIIAALLRLGMAAARAGADLNDPVWKTATDALVALYASYASDDHSVEEATQIGVNLVTWASMAHRQTDALQRQRFLGYAEGRGIPADEVTQHLVVMTS